MNTAMWQHPLTQQQLGIVQEFGNNSNNTHGVSIIAPQVKTLACGEVGNGALATVDDILLAVQSAIK